MIRVGALSVDIKQTSNSKHTSDADIRQDTVQHAAGPHTTMYTEAHHVPRLAFFLSLTVFTVMHQSWKYYLILFCRKIYFSDAVPCESIGLVMRRQVKHIFSLKCVVSCSCVHSLDLKLGRLSWGDVPEPRPHQSLKRGVNTSENRKNITYYIICYNLPTRHMEAHFCR